MDSSNQIPDGDTLGRFRNLLIKNGLQEKLFAQVVALLTQRGLILKKGTIVDSTIIAAPSSTKNKEKKRDDAVVENKSGRKIQYKINLRPSQIKKLSEEEQAVVKEAEHVKSSVRAKAEHAFGVVKKQLRFRKTRYRGLEKQKAKFNIIFALANLIHSRLSRLHIHDTVLVHSSSLLFGLS